MAHRPQKADPLTSARRDIEAIDRAIVVLVAARMHAAHGAIELRFNRDGRVSCPAQEARVLSRARGWGAPLGLNPELTDAVFHALLEAGKLRFAEGIPDLPVAARGRAKAPASKTSPPGTVAVPSS